MMQKVLFFFVVASALNYGSGMSIPPTTDQLNYGNSNGPFGDWFLSKFFHFKFREKISATDKVIIKIKCQRFLTFAIHLTCEFPTSRFVNIE